MEKSFFSVIIAILVLTSCTKSHYCDCPMPDDIYMFKATVINTNDISCNYPVLNFTEDSAKIRYFTQATDLSFVTKELPSQYNSQGKKLYVYFRYPTPEEDFMCTTLGVTLPHIILTNVKERQ